MVKERKTDKDESDVTTVALRLAMRFKLSVASSACFVPL